MKEYDDQIRIDKFNPFFEDDEVINPLDDGFFNNPFDTIQTIPDFDLINMVIQDPYIDGFIPPSTDPFTELGCDKTGVLGKIGYDDEIKKTDEREGDLTDYVTNNPILVVQAGETAEFTLIENNQSPDKYNWIVKESGTVNPRMGQRVTLTAPDSVPDGDEAIKLYLFNEQHQLDYVKIEIESPPSMLFVLVDKKGYESDGYSSYGFVWDIEKECFHIGISEYKENSKLKSWESKTKVVGKELWDKTEAIHCISSIESPHLCNIVGIDGESLYSTWEDINNWYTPSWAKDDSLALTNPYFSSFSLVAMNDSAYIGCVRTDVTGVKAYYRHGGSYYKIVTPIGEFGEIDDRVSFDSGGFDDRYGSPGYSVDYNYDNYYRRGIIKGQYSDTIMSQLYLSQHRLKIGSVLQGRVVECRAQAAKVSNGNTQSPREMERTESLEVAVVDLVNHWYSENGFSITQCTNLMSSMNGEVTWGITWDSWEGVTWELRQ